jgi:hypothetical protein
MGFFKDLDRTIEKNFSVKTWRCKKCKSTFTSNELGLGWRCKQKVKVHKDGRNRQQRCGGTAARA